MLAAELVRAMRQELAEAEAVPTTDYQPLHTGLEPRFFGAGGPQMAAAGVDLAFDMTAHSVIGFSEALQNYLKFRRLFQPALPAGPPAPARCHHLRGFSGCSTAVRAGHPAIHPRARRLVPRLAAQDHPVCLAAGLGLARGPRLPDGARLRPGAEHLPVREGMVCEAGAAIARGVRRPSHGGPVPGGAARAEGQGRGLMGTPMLLLLPGSRPSELRRHLPVMMERPGIDARQGPGSSCAHGPAE